MLNYSMSVSVDGFIADARTVTREPFSYQLSYQHAPEIRTQERRSAPVVI
jgi:hypothetical protein